MTYKGWYAIKQRNQLTSFRSGMNRCVLNFVYLHFALSDTEVLDSVEEIRIMWLYSLKFIVSKKNLLWRYLFLFHTSFSCFKSSSKSKVAFILLPKNDLKHLKNVLKKNNQLKSKFSCWPIHFEIFIYLFFHWTNEKNYIYFFFRVGRVWTIALPCLVGPVVIIPRTCNLPTWKRKWC